MVCSLCSERPAKPLQPSSTGRAAGLPTLSPECFHKVLTFGKLHFRKPLLSSDVCWELELLAQIDHSLPALCSRPTEALGCDLGCAPAFKNASCLRGRKRCLLAVMAKLCQLPSVLGRIASGSNHLTDPTGPSGCCPPPAGQKGTSPCPGPCCTLVVGNSPNTLLLLSLPPLMHCALAFCCLPTLSGPGDFDTSC